MTLKNSNDGNEARLITDAILQFRADTKDPSFNSGSPFDCAERRYAHAVKLLQPYASEAAQGGPIAASELARLIDTMHPPAIFVSAFWNSTPPPGTDYLFSRANLPPGSVNLGYARTVAPGHAAVNLGYARTVPSNFKRLNIR